MPTSNQQQSDQKERATQLPKPMMQNQPPNLPFVQPPSPPVRQAFPPSGIHHEIKIFYGGVADDVDAWFLYQYI
eukprot:m.41249 g.41249  ORF g.41249 m.41249 type:complete len:74 (+) comp33119_c0_seq2:336-557(+)